MSVSPCKLTCLGSVLSVYPGHVPDTSEGAAFVSCCTPVTPAVPLITLKTILEGKLARQALINAAP